MGNPFVHVELHTKDQATAKKFYSQLFDWKLQDLDVAGFGTYTLVDAGTGTGGGMMTNPAPQVPPHWMPYVQVAEVSAAVEKAVKLGGKVVQPRTEIPGFGCFALIQDPTGATVGVYQANAR